MSTSSGHKSFFKIHTPPPIATFRNRICIKFSKVFPPPANLARCNLYSSARKLIRPGGCFENRFNYRGVSANVVPDITLENAKKRKFFGIWIARKIARFFSTIYSNNSNYSVDVFYYYYVLLIELFNGNCK